MPMGSKRHAGVEHLGFKEDGSPVTTRVWGSCAAGDIGWVPTRSAESCTTEPSRRRLAATRPHTVFTAIGIDVPAQNP